MSQRAFAATARAAVVFEKITLLAMLSVITLFVLNMTTPMSGMMRPVSMPRAWITKIEDVAAQPTIFDQEAAMTPSQLLDRWNPFIEEAARKFDLPVSWIRAVMARESGGRTMSPGDTPIMSNVGAVGIMQLMPDTYNDMRTQYRLGDNPADPHDSVIAGAAYLSWLHRKYGFPNMFAAYNDGPTNFDKYLAGGRDMPAETVAYLASLSDKLGDVNRTRRKRTIREARISKSYSVSG